MNTQDLFPETLLVSREGERIYTTSRRVAFYFGKRHDHVLRSTQKLEARLPEILARAKVNQPNFGPINGPNFGGIATSTTTLFMPVEYVDERNRRKPEYQLSEEGFALLAMGFTGDEALYWKCTFLQEFLRLRAEAAKHQAIRVNALDILHPNLLPTVEDFERGLPRMATAQRLGKSEASVTYHRRKARGLGLIPVHAARGQA